MISGEAVVVTRRKKIHNVQCLYLAKMFVNEGEIGRNHRHLDRHYEGDIILQGRRSPAFGFITELSVHYVVGWNLCKLATCFGCTGRHFSAMLKSLPETEFRVLSTCFQLSNSPLSYSVPGHIFTTLCFLDSKRKTEYSRKGSVEEMY